MSGLLAAAAELGRPIVILLVPKAEDRVFQAHDRASPRHAARAVSQDGTQHPLAPQKKDGDPVAGTAGAAEGIPLGYKIHKQDQCLNAKVRAL